MNARKSVVVGMVAALGVAGAIAVANADPQTRPPAPAATESGPGGWGPGMGWGMGFGPHGRHFSKEDRAAFLDARVAAIHAGLKLTPDQEKLWPPVESAVRDMAKTMSDLRDSAQSAGRPKDPIEGMQRMAAATTARGESLKKVADAAGPLYAALTADQKERLPMLTRPGGMRERVGMWMRGHGMHWGWRHDEHGPGGWREGDADGPRMGPGMMGPGRDWH